MLGHVIVIHETTNCGETTIIGFKIFEFASNPKTTGPRKV